MPLLVTGEQMRTVSNNIQAAIESAVVVAQQYLATHEEAMGATWDGQGAGSSFVTAGRIQEDIAKIMTGGQHLAEGLNKAAALMEAHEEDMAHKFNGFGGDLGSSAVSV